MVFSVHKVFGTYRLNHGWTHPKQNAASIIIKQVWFLVVEAQCVISKWVSEGQTHSKQPGTPGNTYGLIGCVP